MSAGPGVVALDWPGVAYVLACVVTQIFLTPGPLTHWLKANALVVDSCRQWQRGSMQFGKAEASRSLAQGKHRL